MKYDKPLILPIKQIITETPRIKTFVFDYDFPGEPGQFVMTWVPGYDEKPFGIIKKDKVGFMISVAAVGEATKALHDMKEGDKLGFRGPYGSRFTLPDSGTIALVAGGYGMVPLSYLAQEARKKGIDVHLFIGARNKDELLFRTWMEELGVIVHIATDDGSAGYKGFNTDLFADYIEHPPVRHDVERPPSKGGMSGSPIEPRRGPFGFGDDKILFEKVYVVGPEVMEVKISHICNGHNIPFEISLERYMKCGFGLCGQCCVDPTGWRMCVEGPVLNQDQLKKVDEFGKYHRTASGKIINHV